MGNQEQAVSAAPNTLVWNEDFVFTMFGDASRRRMFLFIAKNGPQAAKTVNGGVKAGFSAMLKHLSSMCEAGLLVKLKNPADARRPLYAIAPGVPVTKTDNGVIIDFGACLFRLQSK